MPGRDKEDMKHCDDYIHDFSAPKVLRVFLLVHRLPAADKLLLNDAGINPVLYADYEGQTHRVTMASRLGDLGITTKLDRENGYELRVPVEALTNFRDKP
jgi:hypothetical protein